MSDNFLLDSGFWGWLYKLLTPVEWLMTQVMYWFHKLLTLIGMPAVGLSWVLSIIFLVIVVQACVFPLFYKQMKSMRGMQAIQPKMMKIQNKYKGKNDPASKEAMQREMMKLYKDNNANPAGSCLPMLIQGPVFMCMFYVLSAIPYIARGKRQREMMKLYKDNNANPAGSCLPMLIQGPVFMCMFYVLSAIPYIARGKRAPLGAFDVATAQEFSSTTFFGTKVSDTFTTAGTSGKIVIGIFVFAMCACLWYMQWNTMRRNTAPASMNKQTERMQKMMLWIFPVMYIFSGVAMPFAVLVYWLANNICNLLRSFWQLHEFPTPGSPAAEDKEKRDHDNENKRRAAKGLPSIEEEKLLEAKQEAERKASQGHQRQQPQRKNRRKK